MPPATLRDRPRVGSPSNQSANGRPPAGPAVPSTGERRKRRVRASPPRVRPLLTSMANRSDPVRSTKFNLGSAISASTATATGCPTCSGWRASSSAPTRSRPSAPTTPASRAGASNQKPSPAAIAPIGAVLKTLRLGLEAPLADHLMACFRGPQTMPAPPGSRWCASVIELIAGVGRLAIIILAQHPLAAVAAGQIEQPAQQGAGFCTGAISSVAA